MFDDYFEISSKKNCDFYDYLNNFIVEVFGLVLLIENKEKIELYV